MRTLFVLFLASLPACNSGGTLGPPTPRDDDDSGLDDDDTASDDDDATSDDDDTALDDDDTALDDDDTTLDDDDTADPSPFEGPWAGQLWLTRGDSDQSICWGQADLWVEANGDLTSDGWCQTISGAEVWFSFWGTLDLNGQLGGSVWTQSQWDQVEAEYPVEGSLVSDGTLRVVWQGELLRPNGMSRPYTGNVTFWQNDGTPPPSDG